MQSDWLAIYASAVSTIVLGLQVWHVRQRRVQVTPANAYMIPRDNAFESFKAVYPIASLEPEGALIAAWYNVPGHQRPEARIGVEGFVVKFYAAGGRYLPKASEYLDRQLWRMSVEELKAAYGLRRSFSKSCLNQRSSASSSEACASTSS